MNNIILNAPLPTVSKQEYDNKILLAFLILMVILATMGLFFVNISKEVLKNAPLKQENMPNLTES